VKFIIFFLIFASGNARSNDLKVTYGLDVDLIGTLDLQTFPGPPSYESIKSGDEVERYFYLRLAIPINVLPNLTRNDIQNAVEEKNVRTIQLSIGDDENLWEKIRRMGKGVNVKIKGNLFHRFTGHHHSRVLMVVKAITKQ
jgi:hypothetical protein